MKVKRDKLVTGFRVKDRNGAGVVASEVLDAAEVNYIPGTELFVLSAEGRIVILYFPIGDRGLEVSRGYGFWVLRGADYDIEFI